MKVLSHGCTLDCFDCCKFNIYVENGQVLKIEVEELVELYSNGRNAIRTLNAL